MKPSTVKVFSCATCGKVFPLARPLWLTATRDGGIEAKEYITRQKKFALACCTCRNCGKKNDRYMGTDQKLCSKCKDEGEWEMIVADLERALGRYEGICHRRGNKYDPGIESDLAEHVRKMKS